MKKLILSILFISFLLSAQAQSFGKKRNSGDKPISSSYGTALSIDGSVGTIYTAKYQDGRTVTIVNEKEKTTTTTKYPDGTITVTEKYANGKTTTETRDRFGNLVEQESLVTPSVIAEGTAQKQDDPALFPQRNNKGKWGFVNAKGKYKIKARYDAVEDFSCGLSCVENGGLFGFINESGDLVIPIIYESASSYTKVNTGETVSVCRKNGKYGILKEDGSTYLDFKYDNLEMMGTACCKAMTINHDTTMFLVTFGSKPAVKEYNKIEDFVGKYAKAQRNEKWFFIDNKGKEVAGKSYDGIGEFDAFSVAAVFNDGKYGLVDANLNYLVPCKYPYYDYYKLVHFIGNSDDAFGFVYDGKLVLSPDNVRQSTLYHFDEMVVYKGTDGVSRLVTYEGEEILNTTGDIVQFEEDQYEAKCGNYSTLYDAIEHKYGFKCGKTVYWAPDDAVDFSFDGVVATYYNKRNAIHYVSRNGKPLFIGKNVSEVRKLNDKYLAVLLNCEKPKSTESHPNYDQNNPMPIGGEKVYIAHINCIWEIANVDGKILTDKKFEYLGSFDSKGNLPYKYWNEKKKSYSEGRLRVTGDKVSY